MQGISKKKYTLLVEALLQLERLQQKEPVENECLKQTENYRVELEALYDHYEQLLADLSGQITAYEMLYSRVKNQYLGKKLKELKKTLPPEAPVSSLLIQNIHLVYGT